MGNTNSKTVLQIGENYGPIDIDRSRNKTVNNIQLVKIPAIKSDGKIGFFNFDLSIIPGIIANRDTELCQLRTALKKSTGSGAKIAILAGLGGAGKTTIVRLYTQAEKGAFINLIWIDSEEPKNVATAFQEILKDRLNDDRVFAEEKQLIDAVYEYILKHKTLLVFDNVENVQDIQRFLPKVIPQEAPSSHVILTTRVESGWQDLEDHHLVPVGALSFQVSEVYIRANLAKSKHKIPDVDTKWKELADYFGGLVIALRAATITLVEQNNLLHSVGEEAFTLEAFLQKTMETPVMQEFESNPKDPTTAAYRPLRKLWTSTLDSLPHRPDGELAERILEALAYLSPSGVPAQWFQTLCGGVPGSRTYSLMHSMSFLTSWSLAQRSEQNVVVHRVLQQFLLVRIKSRAEKRTQTLEWFLPSLQQLHSKLRTENKLQSFYPNLNSLHSNIENEIQGNVAEVVVSFLVSIKLPDIYKRRNLLEELISNVFKNVASVTSHSLRQLSSPSLFQMADNNVLMLPNWIRDFSGEMPTEDQVWQVQHSLHLHFPNDQYRQLCVSPAFYLQVLEVVIEWGAEVKANPTLLNSSPETGLEALCIVKCLCKGLFEWMKDNTNINDTREDFDKVLAKLKEGLVAGLEVLFRQSPKKRRKIVDFFESSEVISNWYLTLTDTKQKFGPCDTLPELDSVLKFAGVDDQIIAWHQIKLELFYSGCQPSSENIEEQIKLEARFIALVLCTLAKSLSYAEESADSSRSSKNPSRKQLKIPHGTIMFLRFLDNWKWKYENSIMRAYLVYLGLEQQLELLEEILDRFNEAGDDEHKKNQLVLKIEDFIEALLEIVNKNEAHEVYSGIQPVPLLSIFKEPWARQQDPARMLKTLFPNIQKLTRIIQSLLAHYSEAPDGPSSTDILLAELTSKCDHPAIIVETIEGYYDHQFEDGRNLTPISQLRPNLEQAYKAALALANATDPLRSCECLVARYQTMIAWMDLEEAHFESAITLATQAFNHQLFCDRSKTMDRTVQVLLDAHGKFDDAQAAQVRREDLLRKLIDGHIEIYGINHDTTHIARLKYIRFSCSNGSMLEAADCCQKWLNDLQLHEIFILMDSVEDVLIVALLTLLCGEYDSVPKISDCLFKNVKAMTTDFDFTLPLFDRCTRFFVLLKEVAASRSSNPASTGNFNIAEFRKGAVAWTCKDKSLKEDPEVGDQYYNGLSTIYKQWLADAANFGDGDSRTWREKRSIDTSKLLDQDTLKILWFDTMEEALFGSSKNFSESVISPLEHQLELRNFGTEFRLKDSVLEWGIKCFMGMFRRQELWFQKAGGSC